MTDFADLLAEWDFHRPWYHGSPHRLEFLLAGSTITQDKDVARVFSHKPQIVLLNDDPKVLAQNFSRLRHNGELPGMLYLIDEALGSEDIYPHPRSSMPPGLEWLTRRLLRLRMLNFVAIDPYELLSSKEISEIIELTKVQK
jgi:hypothetical protein